MQITLPDDPQIQRRAIAAGFVSVESYVQDLVRRDAAHPTDENGVTDSGEQSAEEWIREFRAIFDKMPKANLNYDDSRESIYPVR